MKKTFFGTRNTGQIALITVIFFLLISIVSLGAFVALGISQLRAANELLYGTKSYATAESGIEDISWRIANGVSTCTPLPCTKDQIPTVGTLNSGNASVSINDSLGAYVLISQGIVNDNYRRVEVKFPLTTTQDGFGFDSAIQAGFLGITMLNTAEIYNIDPTKPGNVFSNGTYNSSGTSQDHVFGNITVATSTGDDITWAQASPYTGSPSDIILGDIASHKYIAQSFIASATAQVVKVAFPYIKNFGGAGALNIDIRKNIPGSDKPDMTAANLLAQKTINAGVIPAGPGSFNIILSQRPGNYVTTENVKYWIVLYTSVVNISKYYVFSLATSDYTGEYGENKNKPTCYGQTWCNNYNSSDVVNTRFRYSLDGSTWASYTPATADIAFQVYFGEETINNHFDTQVYGAETRAPLSDPSCSQGCGITARTIKSSIATGIAKYKYTSPTVVANGTTCPASGSNGPNCVGDGIIPQAKSLWMGATFWQQDVNKDWKNIAASGQVFNPFCTPGYTYTISTPTSLGPAKICGNLVVNTNTTLTIIGDKNSSGTRIGRCPYSFPPGDINQGKDCNIIWVTGTAVFQSNGCTIKLDTMNANAYLIFDGPLVEIQDHCKFLVPIGSTGNIYIISTYNNPALVNPSTNIKLSNYVNDSTEVAAFSPAGTWAASGIFFAPIGVIEIANQASVTAMSAARILFSQGSVYYKNWIATLASPFGQVGTTPAFFEYHEVE
jgi:hypothetical protein